jgi:enhancing lycopene biosynthesis protein 2
MVMKKIAVVLSGCGFLDGAEITESVSSLIALAQNGVDYQIFSLNRSFNAAHPITGVSTSQTRNILEESARIARGKISDLADLLVEEFDGVVFPGGYGIVKHFCNWAERGAGCDVDPVVRRVLEDFHRSSRPILAVCIAPVLVARVLGCHGVDVTIGFDHEIAGEINKTGAHHVECGVNDYVTDRANKIVTTPAFMYDVQHHEVFAGISGAVREFVEMA